VPDEPALAPPRGASVPQANEQLAALSNAQTRIRRFIPEDYAHVARGACTLTAFSCRFAAVGPLLHGGQHAPYFAPATKFTLPHLLPCAPFRLMYALESSQA